MCLSLKMIKTRGEKMRASAWPCGSGGAFTLIEVLVALSIFVIASGLAYMSFSIVSHAWTKGMDMADNLHHGDFVMDQLVTGLRSAYYPNTRGAQPEYGFYHEDNGVDSYSSDVISWVKTGASLIGSQDALAGTPHRTEFMVEPGLDGESSAGVRAWRTYGLPEDFDPDEIELRVLSERVTGFNCRTAIEKKQGEIEWLDEWEETNRLPMAIELTLFLTPLAEDEEPVEIKRIVGVPVALQAWK